MRKHRSVGRSGSGLSHGLAIAPSRRMVLKSVAAGIGLSTLSVPAILIPGKASAATPLVVALWGGAFTEAFKAAYLDPFTRETGIEIIVVGPPDIAKVRAMVRTNNIEWDVVMPTPIWQTGGEKEGLWEPIDYSIVDMSDTALGAKREYGVGFEIISGGICWNEDRNGAAGKHPETFPEFFDPKTFPGRRGLRPREFETIEIALLADGVPPASMYPLDIDRAFRVLDRIKPYITNWIEATQQTISLVQQNECDFTYTYNGRVFAARQAGIPIGFSLKSNINSMDYLAIVKGTKNKNSAMQLLAFVMRPDRQADFANRVVYAGTKRKTMELVSDKVKPFLPNLTNPNSIFIDIDFWRDKQAEVEKRFKEWLLI
jgi:putative spermidine/putrescine transport system substrate-binding protein